MFNHHIPKPVSLEQKSNARFIVNFKKPFEEIPSFCVKEASRPVFNFEFNNWAPIVLKLYDPIGPSTSHAILKGVNEYKKDSEPKICFDIDLLDPVGDVVEHWELEGHIKTLDFGKLSYDNIDKALEITMVIILNNVVLEDFQDTINSNKLRYSQQNP